MGLEIYYNTNYDNAQHVYSNIWRAQTFTTVDSFTIESVKLLLSKIGGTSGTITVDLHAVDGARKPTGSVLATATADGTSLPGYPGSWLTFTFVTPYLLAAATEYALVVHCPQTGTYWTYDSTGSPYSDGITVASGDSGSTWGTIITTADQMFETYSPDAEYVDLSASIEDSDSVSGTLETAEYVDLSASIEDSDSVSGTLILGTSWETDTAASTKRLVVVGNDQLYYEDI